MNRPTLESLNSELFESIDTKDAGSVVGALGVITYSHYVTGGTTGVDTSIDADFMP